MNEVIANNVDLTPEQVAALMATANLSGDVERIDPSTVDVVEGSFSQEEAPTIH